MSNKKLVKQFSYGTDRDGDNVIVKDSSGGLMRVKDVRRLIEKVEAHLNAEPGAGAALREELNRFRRVRRTKT